MSHKKIPQFRFSLATRTEKERDFLADLEQTFEQSPFTTLEKLMNFPLYVPRQNITNFIIKYEIFKRVLHVHGSIVECGVSFGGGTLTFAHLSAILEPTNYQRKIIGFDTFAGIPGLSAADEGSTSQEARTKGLAVNSYREVQRCAELHDKNRFVGHVPKVELVKGDARETIPRYVQENNHLLVSLLYLDFDIYEPTRIALEHFVPRMPKGAVIVFDELNLKDWPGETKAVLEMLPLRTLRIERFPFGSTISFAQME